MNTKDYWKIFTTDKSIVILTDVPNEYHNGDGVYILMKQLQKIYGSNLCSFQKFDESSDKIEDFNIILRTGYNIDGNRLLCAHLFDYDPKTEILLVDNTKSLRMKEDHEYVYRVQKTQIKCIDGWNGLRKHILWTMGRDACWTFWGDSQFGEQNIISLERKKISSELAEAKAV